MPVFEAFPQQAAVARDALRSRYGDGARCVVNPEFVKMGADTLRGAEAPGACAVVLRRTMAFEDRVQAETVKAEALAMQLPKEPPTIAGSSGMRTEGARHLSAHQSAASFTKRQLVAGIPADNAANWDNTVSSGTVRVGLGVGKGSEKRGKVIDFRGVSLVATRRGGAPPAAAAPPADATTAAPELAAAATLGAADGAAPAGWHAPVKRELLAVLRQLGLEEHAGELGRAGIDSVDGLYRAMLNDDEDALPSIPAVPRSLLAKHVDMMRGTGGRGAPLHGAPVNVLDCIKVDGEAIGRLARASDEVCVAVFAPLARAQITSVDVHTVMFLHDNPCDAVHARHLSHAQTGWGQLTKRLAGHGCAWVRELGTRLVGGAPKPPPSNDAAPEPATESFWVKEPEPQIDLPGDFVDVPFAEP